MAQIVCPVALAAAIFSMQQEAIPFKQSPRSFAITVFMLMVMVYVTHLFGKYALPPMWRRIIALWVKERDEIRAMCKTLEEVEVGETIQAMKGPDLENPPVDEEEVVSMSILVKSRRWIDSWKIETPVR
jgi:hypothetical protein